MPMPRGSGRAPLVPTLGVWGFGPGVRTCWIWVRERSGAGGQFAALMVGRSGERSRDGRLLGGHRRRALRVPRRRAAHIARPVAGNVRSSLSSMGCRAKFCRSWPMSRQVWSGGPRRSWACLGTSRPRPAPVDEGMLASVWDLANDLSRRLNENGGRETCVLEFGSWSSVYKNVCWASLEPDSGWQVVS